MHSCESCNKKFSRADALKAHQFNCPSIEKTKFKECLQKYTRKQNMKKHKCVAKYEAKNQTRDGFKYGQCGREHIRKKNLRTTIAFC